MNHPQLQIDGVGDGGGQPVYYESMQVEGMASQFQFPSSMISGHEQGGVVRVDENLVMDQTNYPANANPEQHLPLPPMSCLRRPEYIYSQPSEFPISQNDDMLIMAVPHPVQTVPNTGTGQVPYYHHQLPVNQMELEVVRSSVNAIADIVPANSLQIENAQGQRNIYDIGEQVVANVTSRNHVTGNPAGETGSTGQYQQQEVGVMNPIHAVEMPVAPTIVQSTVILSGEPMSQSSSSSSQLARPQQSVIRHTEEFSQTNPVPLSRLPTERGFKLNTSRTSRPLRVMAPQRKSGAKIIQLPLQHQSRHPPSPGVPAPIGGSVPQHPQPGSVAQQQIIVTRGIGTHYPRTVGMSKPRVTNSGPIPVVDINDSDEEDNATNVSVSTYGNAIQKRNLSPSLTVTQSMVPIVPPAQCNMVREQWSTPPPPTGEQSGSSSMFYTSNSGSLQIATAATAMAPQGTGQVKKKRNYSPRKPKQPVVQQQREVPHVAGIVAALTAEIGAIGGAAVKPKRKSTPRKPKPSQPPAGPQVGVSEVAGNLTTESGSGEGTVKPKRKSTPRKPKQSPSLPEGGVAVADVAGNITGEIAATVKPKRKYTPRKPAAVKVTPTPATHQDVAELILKVVSGGGVSEVCPVKPKRNYTRKPKVPPQVPPSTQSTVPVQDNLSAMPLPCNPSAIGDPSSSHMVNVQPQPHTSGMTGIPQDITQESHPVVGADLKGSASPQRGRSRARKQALSNGPKVKIDGTRVYTHTSVMSPDITANATATAAKISDPASNAKCIDIMDTEQGKLINNESIESGIMVEDGLRIRGNNGENLIILNYDTDTIQIQNKNDVLMDSSSDVLESLVEDDNVKTEKTMLPISDYQPRNLVHGNIDGGTEILTDVVNSSSCDETEEATLKYFQMSSEAHQQPSVIAKTENPSTSDQTEDYQIETAGLNQGDMVNLKDDNERLDMEVDQLPPATPELYSGGKRELANKQIESSLSEDNSESVPYSARLKRNKIDVRLNSSEKTKSSLTGSGSENDEGSSRRTTRSAAKNRSAALDPYQSKENMEEDFYSTKGKRKLEYGDSDSEIEWTDDNDDFSNDETVAIRKPNDKSNSNGGRSVTSQRGIGTKFGRGRGRGRGRPPLCRSIVKNRVVKTAKGIARKMTHANIVSSMDSAMKSLQIQKNRVTKHQEQLRHDEEEPVIALDHHIMENVGVGNWKVQTATEPEMFRVKSGFAPPQPQYTDEEREMLYGDQRFVIDLNDYGKDPENMFIWQIHEDGRYLRQYYPSKFAGRQFHSSSPLRWFFFEEDFKSEAFYKRFQPIVVIIANTKVCFPKTKYADAMVERIVQFVYIDKIFFAQMAKHLGRIHKTEYLRSAFMDSLPVYTMTAIVPDFLRTVTQNDSECYRKFKPYVFAWQVISYYINTTIEQACSISDMSKETFAYLIHFPDLSYSIKNVNKKKTCSACPEKGRMPVVRVTFGLKDLRPKPYNLDTLEELSVDQTLKLPNETLYWCETCSRAAKKFHRFYHFRYSMHRVVKQNIAKDVALFNRCNAEVTDALLIWIMKTERSWQNAMFLDFQVCAAEMEAEFVPTTAVETADAEGVSNPAVEMESAAVSNAVEMESAGVSNAVEMESAGLSNVVEMKAEGVSNAVEMECTNSMDELIEDLIN